MLHRQRAQNLSVTGNSSRVVLAQLVSWANRGTSSENLVRKFGDKRKNRRTEWRKPEVPAWCRRRAGKETPMAQLYRQPGLRSSTAQGMYLHFHKADIYSDRGQKVITDGGSIQVLISSTWKQYFPFRHRKGSSDNPQRAKFLNIEVPNPNNAEETWIRMTNITSASFLYWKKNTFSTNNTTEELKPTVINQAGVFRLVFAFF